MLQGKRTRRMIAATLLTVMLTNTLAPTVTYALTSGPTAPEATSFEPVDTTDMVNMETGDLTYNLPLMEVPGPEGGYPLSLSYHANIQPNEDASWVGLGWSLNTGSIARSVNGYPDDFKGVSNIVRDYNSGGQTYTVGLQVGYTMGNANASFGLSASWDTYRGFGMDAEMGLGATVGGVDLGLKIGEDGSPSASLGLSSGMAVKELDNAVKLAMNVNVTTNFNSFGFDGGLGLKAGAFKLGASMSTDLGSPAFSASAHGVSASVSNPSAGRVQTKGFGFSVPIPNTYASLSFSYNRYWSDETNNINVFGSLYNRLEDNTSVSDPLSPDFGKTAFDTYELPDPSKNIVSEPNPARVKGGSFLEYDFYSVQAQGLGGVIRPYGFQEQVFHQNQKQNGGTETAVGYSPYQTGFTNKKKQFRFVNDFSNKYLQSADAFSYDQIPGYPTGVNYVQSTFHFGTPSYGNNDPQNNNGYDVAQNRLAGSRHIEYFTNADINNGNAQLKGFLKMNQGAGSFGSGYTMVSDSWLDAQIGGFMITNESGVSYHFALPAYAGSEEIYTEKTGGASTQYTDLKKPASYAYTWYLTSVTGPDYVDKNHNGYADDEDWGYWVDFDYGAAGNDYTWRNPGEGYTVDVDNQFQNYSKGLKELYYLNAIRTRTHTAIFEKEFRTDGKGVAASVMTNRRGEGGWGSTSRGVLRLNRIFLLNKGDQNIVSPYTAYSSYPDNVTKGYNTIETDDVAAVSNMVDKALRIIEFKYDYSLCPNTANSFNYNSSDRFGKLTLNAVQIRGKQGQLLLPPTTFQYDLAANEKVTGNVAFTSYNTTTKAGVLSTAAALKKGDIIKFTTGGQTLYAVVSSDASGSNYNYLLFYNPANTDVTNVNTSFETTKNPPYMQEAYDMWGQFKVDFNQTTFNQNQNLGRLASYLSSLCKDVWLLRKIKTPVGSEIQLKYESDSYSNSVLNGNASLLLSSFSNFDVGTGTVSFNVATDGYKLSDVFSIGDKVNFMALQPVRYQPDPFCGYASFETATSDYCTNGSGANTYTQYKDPEFSSTSFLQFKEFYTRILDTRPYGSCSITTIDDQNGRLTVANAGLQTAVNKTNKLEYLGGAIATTSPQVWTYRHLAPVTGNLFFDQLKAFYGGDVRVQSVSVTNPVDMHVKTVTFNYNEDNGMTSGVTAYEPTVFDVYNKGAVRDTWMLPENWAPSGSGWNKDYREFKYKKVLYGQISELLKESRIAPPPGILYRHVTIQTSIKNGSDDAIKVEGKTEYEYDLFDKRKLSIDEKGKNEFQIGSNNADTCENRNFIIRNLSALTGVKRIASYGYNANNNTYFKIKETVNDYLHDDVTDTDPVSYGRSYEQLLQKYNSQGLIQERYVVIKKRYYYNNSGAHSGDAFVSVMGMVEELPLVKRKSTTTDYIKGTTETEENISFDFYSGEVTKTLTVDPYGNRFVTEKVPAYQYYPQMGLGFISGNKNMLTQIASNCLYKVKDNNDPIGVISANMQTWSNTANVIDANGASHVQNSNISDINLTSYKGNVWRPQTNYSWMPETKTPDGITAKADYDLKPFKWSDPASSDAAWKKILEVSLYDVNSASLEAKDINGNASATHMGYNNSKVVISGASAKYAELAYSGAEDETVNSTSNNFINRADGVVTAGVSHTGSKCLKLGASGQKGFVYTVNTNDLQANRKYVASVWVKPVSGTASDVKLYYDLNGSVQTSPVSSANTSLTAGDWKLINISIPALPANGILKVGCRNDASVEAYVDDMRFRPLNASATAYVYDAFSGELTHVLDNNNFYTRFEYDGVGRLINTYVEKKDIGEYKSKNWQYNYGNLTVNSSDPINETFTRNNCPSGQWGTGVPITLAAGAFTSGVSKDDANAMARAWAQAQANRQGSCFVPIVTLKLINNANASSFRAVVNNVSYNFSATGTTTFTVSPGTYTVQIAPIGGLQGTYAFTYVCGPDTQTITGTSADFGSRTVSLNSTIELTISNNP